VLRLRKQVSWQWAVMMCLVFSWVHFFVEAGLLLARLNFNIGFEMMID
jgi:hypothetical protein